LREYGKNKLLVCRIEKISFWFVERKHTNMMTEHSTFNQDGTHPTLAPLAPQRERSSRRFFLRSSLLGAAAVVPTTLIAACAKPPTPSSQTGVTPSATNQATALPAFRSLSESQQAFQEIMNNEDQHVAFLQSALKSAARPKPTFKNLSQKDLTSFATLSQAFENVGVGAYLMAAPAIKDKGILAAAGSILTIEARHAGFLDALLQKPLGPNGAFDKPMTQTDIVSAASPFIASLNGGPDPSAPLTSDTDILNFALLLEFLEAEFYNTNVPKLFA
jgi:Ferritin-like domain